MLHVRIERVDPDGQVFEQSYQIDGDEQMTVLEALEKIQQLHDPTLAYRCSCRIGVCGTCSLIINGKPGLSCLKKVELDEYGVVSIKPIPKGKTCVDLVKV